MKCTASEHCRGDEERERLQEAKCSDEFAKIKNSSGVCVVRKEKEVFQSAQVNDSCSGLTCFCLFYLIVKKSL